MNCPEDTKALIFDLDGTLVQSTEFDTRLYLQAVRHVLGDVIIHDDWTRYTHVTDAGILRQIMDENGVAGDSKEKMAEVRGLFGKLVGNHLREHPCEAVEGAVCLLDELKRDPMLSVGFATGGWGHTARMKLESAGFDVDGFTLCSSDDHYARTEIMKMCRDRLCPGATDVVYVGDAPWDVAAARELGWELVGVGPNLEGILDFWVPNFACPEWRETLMCVFRSARANRKNRDLTP